MDQGSVVVLHRRTTHLEFVVMSFVHRDLNYSGLYPQLQHLIPDPITPVRTLLASLDQGSGVTDKVDRPCNHALTLLAFVGASPQNIYSFEWR